MAQRILKFGPILPYGVEPPCEVLGQPVRAGMQDSDLFVWSIVDDDLPQEQKMSFVATAMDFAGTYRFTVSDDPWTWHVVELEP